MSWFCRFKEHLGVGQFGSVSRATWTNEEGEKKVAVKTLKPTMLTSKKVKFLQEAAIMGQFFHSNVIRLFGVVTVGEPVSKIATFMFQTEHIGPINAFMNNFS